MPYDGQPPNFRPKKPESNKLTTSGFIGLMFLLIVGLFILFLAGMAWELGTSLI